MKNGYLDGFVFPIPTRHLSAYKNIATRVADLWCTYGATDYHEFLGDALFFQEPFHLRIKLSLQRMKP